LNPRPPNPHPAAYGGPGGYAASTDFTCVKQVKTVGRDDPTLTFGLSYVRPREKAMPRRIEWWRTTWLPLQASFFPEARYIMQ
jgi:hypothetical protein